MSKEYCFQAFKYLDGLCELDSLQERIRVALLHNRDKESISIKDLATILGLKSECYYSRINDAIDGLRNATCTIDGKVYYIYKFINKYLGKILYKHNKDLDIYLYKQKRDFCKSTRHILGIKQFKVLRFSQYLLAKSIYFTTPEFTLYIGSFRKRFSSDLKFNRFLARIVIPALDFLETFFDESYSYIRIEKCLKFAKKKADQLETDQPNLNNLKKSIKSNAMDLMSKTSIPNTPPPVNSSYNKDNSLELRSKDSKDLKPKKQVDSCNLVQAPASYKYNPLSSDKIKYTGILDKDNEANNWRELAYSIAEYDVVINDMYKSNKSVKEFIKNDHKERGDRIREYNDFNRKNDKYVKGVKACRVLARLKKTYGDDWN